MCPAGRGAEPEPRQAGNGIELQTAALRVPQMEARARARASQFAAESGPVVALANIVEDALERWRCLLARPFGEEMRQAIADQWD